MMAVSDFGRMGISSLPAISNLNLILEGDRAWKSQKNVNFLELSLVD
jgi:hypothetical protein